MRRSAGGLFLVAFLMVAACGRSDSSSTSETTTSTEVLGEPEVPVGVECNADFKDARPPLKVGKPYRVKLTAKAVDSKDVVLASTNGSTTNYEKDVDGYDYIITASRPGPVKLLVFHRIEVGKNPLCTFEYVFE